jgi:hypothetical protein
LMKEIDSWILADETKKRKETNISKEAAEWLHHEIIISPQFRLNYLLKHDLNSSI